MNSIGIKVSPSTNTTLCIKLLRKLVPLPLSEMKRRIAEGECIYIGKFTDTEDVDKAVEVYTTLTSAGIDAQCTHHRDRNNTDEILSFELLQNWCNTCHEIDEEDERMMDLYFGDDSESEL